MENYKKLDISYELPSELSNAIDGYLYHLNQEDGDVMDDCWREEIRVILNWCYRENILSSDNIEELRNYYQRGGIQKSEIDNEQNNLDNDDFTILEK